MKYILCPSCKKKGMSIVYPESKGQLKAKCKYCHTVKLLQLWTAPNKEKRF